MSRVYGWVLREAFARIEVVWEIPAEGDASFVLSWVDNPKME